jgi:hypothetical protein
LKEETLDRTVWRTNFGRGSGPVVRQTAERWWTRGMWLCFLTLLFCSQQILREQSEARKTSHYLFCEQQNRNAKVGQVSHHSCDSWICICMYVWVCGVWVYVYVCVCVCVCVCIYIYVYIYIYPCHNVNAWFQKSCLNSWLYPVPWIVTLVKHCVAVTNRLRTTV